MRRCTWKWSLAIALTSLAAGLTVFVLPGLPVRPLCVFLFMGICPGAALLRFLRLDEWIMEITLAIALSFSLDSLLGAAQLYMRLWAPTTTLAILLVMVVITVFIYEVQEYQLRQHSRTSSAQRIS